MSQSFELFTPPLENRKERTWIHDENDINLYCYHYMRGLNFYNIFLYQFYFLNGSVLFHIF